MTEEPCSCRGCNPQTYEDLGFTEEEFLEIVEYYDELLGIVLRYEAKQAKRFELISILVAIKKQKIEREQARLQNEINKLQLL
jgi:hypothetical protein